MAIKSRAMAKVTGDHKYKYNVPMDSAAVSSEDADEINTKEKINTSIPESLFISLQI